MWRLVDYYNYACACAVGSSHAGAPCYATADAVSHGQTASARILFSLRTTARRPRSVSALAHELIGHPIPQVFMDHSLLRKLITALEEPVAQAKKVGVDAQTPGFKSATGKYKLFFRYFRPASCHSR